MRQRRSMLERAVEVECARRKWTLSRLAEEVEAAYPDCKYHALRQRIHQAIPLKSTAEMVAAGFGMTLDQFRHMVNEEYLAACSRKETPPAPLWRNPEAAIEAI